MITMTAGRIVMALAPLVTDGLRFLNCYLVVPHLSQDYLVRQRVAVGRSLRRRAFRAGGH
jgi:hypothetical protein